MRPDERKEDVIQDNRSARSTGAVTSRPLVLASASPRRRGLIDALCAPVELVAPEDEEAPRRNGETPEEFVLRLARSKATEVSGRVGDAVIIGADTAVVVDGVVLGKPGSPEEATSMLRRLRGRTHRVVTGVSMLDGASGDEFAASKSTDVLMRRYSDEDIAAYVASSGPFDKAGGYAVQDPVFSPAASVEGCYLNVVGLPLCEVVALLTYIGAENELEAGWNPPAECTDCELGTAEAGR